MFQLTSFCLGLVPVRGPSGYANPLFVHDALDPLLTMTAPPEAITAPGALGSVAGVDEKMHEKPEERKAENQLGQNSVVQNGTRKNWQAVNDRNKKDVNGDASLGRTHDLLLA